MQTIRKKTSPLKYRNEPGRFFGDGVSFKAKLIGILEVGEARGDRMCQEALQDLKMAIRAAGEHKQRITIHVTIDGLRLRDEKTGDSLYHHPVHKISFIAQDMTDSRAFGYIFGSPDSGHRFFGIKTDKAASQVVLAMRDLFQVVFELKKKEIELARQHIQSKITAHEHQAASSATLMSAKTSSAMDGGGGSYGKNHTSDPLGVLAGASGSASGGGAASSSSRDTGAGSSRAGGGMGTLGKSEKSPESVADLVDLEQELSCIQRGITQMERITPSEGPGKSVIDDDPFGDSFANIPPAYNLLPPPESSKRHQKQANNRSTENLPKASETSSPVVVSSSPPPVAAPPVPSSAASYESAASTTPGGASSSAQAAAASATAAAASTTVPNVNNSSSQSTSRHTPLLSTSQSSAQNDDWLNSPPNTSRFDPDPVRYSDEPKLAEDSPKVQATGGSAAQPSSYTDVFTDLDPLGTGKIKPYIDKKYFFQELKNPPKKVLKDLSGKDTATFNANFATEDHPLGGGGAGASGGSMLNASNISTLASGSGELFKANFEEAQAKLHPEPPMAAIDDGGGLSSSKQQQHTTTLESSLGVSAPKNIDLFQEDEDFSKLQLDPFEVHFSRNASPRPAPGPTQRGTEHRSSDGGDENVGEGGPTGRGEEEPSDGTPGKAGVYNGPLQVNLPPESWASYISQKRLERQTSEANAQQLSGVGGGIGAVGGSMARNRPAASSVFKQNTVDVISSLSSSSKKMKPNLFGQKFSKRDSHSINMRRLQESDSLSETETAPEPPPRPDSASHIEPPPLPPKKQFADIVIRPSPRPSSHSAAGGGNGNGSSSSFGDRGSAGGAGGGQRYDYVCSKYDSTANRSSPQASGSGPASDAPPLPLPSRKVGRTAGDTIGPGRPPHRKSNEEEDYLTPIAGKPDIPTLLPPPQRKDGSKTSRSNARKQSETDPRNLDEPTPPPTSKSPLSSVFSSKEQALHSHSKQPLGGIGPGAGSSSFLPDITLSQLLTLGIDELAAKLGVPVSKLSTMTLVELTSYLSEFIENSKQPATGSTDTGYPDGVPGGLQRDGSVSESPVFKVNFDDSNEFVAKFDDNFGEDDDRAAPRSIGPAFVANFDELNVQPTVGPRGGFTASSHSQPSAPSIPSTASSVIDKYAVFREIMDQDTGGEAAGAGSTGAVDSDREQEQTGASSAHGRLDLQAEVTTEMNRLSPAFAGEGLSPSATGDTAFGLLAGGGNSAPLAQLPMTKIDTKITEVISQAKDRYAALRDIILVEDLFEKPAPMARAESSSFEERDPELDDAKFEANFDDMIAVVGAAGTGNSPGINVYDVSEPSNVELDDVTMPAVEGSGMTLSGSFARISNATPREDLEIDELMQQAVSNLSLHTSDQHQLASQQGPTSQSQSLTVKGSPMQVAHSSTSPYRPPTSTSTTLLNDMIGPPCGSGGRSPAYTPEGMNLGPAGKTAGGTVIDTSTSPIPLGPKQGMAARSPILKPSSGDLPKSGTGGVGGMKKKPTPAPRGTGTGGQSSSEKRSSGSVSDGDDETSPEADNMEGGKRSRNTPTNSNESWAVFDQPEPPLPPHSSKRQELRHESRHESARRGDKNGPDSPCSSDPKDEWTKAAELREYGRRWPSKGGHTSSSSRDVSPWDEEGPDFRKRHLHGSQSSQPPLPPSHHHQQHHHHHHPTSGERYHHPRMPPRRINSNDEDYEDEQQQNRGMRRRGMKGGVGSRSRDNFDDEHWYHDHHHATTWSSPTEDDESRAHAASRSFDRNVYERSTYGPPYEKREPKSLPPYDRRDYKGYADGGKRKYYREREQSRGRSSYDYDPYTGGGGGDGGYGGRGRVDYDDTYGCRGDAREAREYFYDRERKSFDRESNESYDSRERRSGFGSGDLYGSLDSRAEYREQRDRDRDRYLSLDKGRSLRRGMRNAGSARLDQELDQDSEGDLMGGGMMGGRSSTGGGVNSLHRSSQNIGRMGGGKHGHGQQQQQQQQMLMDDDVWGVAAKGAGAPWKRPSSATEQDRRYDGGSGRRSGPPGGVGPSNQIGSDGEKDRRFRKKSRSRTSVGDRKDLELRSSNYATMRYPLRPKEDYFDFDAVEGGGGSAGHGGGRRNSAGMAALDDDDDDDEEDEEEEEDDGGVGDGRPSGGTRTAGGGMLMDDPLDDSPAYYGRRQVPPQSSSMSSGYYGKSSSLAARHQEQVGGRAGNLMNPAEALIAQEAKKMSRYEYEEEAQRRMKKSNSRDLYFDGSERGGYGGSVSPPPPKGTATSAGGSKHHQATTGGRMEFEFDEFGDALAPSGGGGGKFSSGNYEPPGDGFESDFNSPPTMGTATTGPSSMVVGGGQPKSYRFSNDFSIDKDRGGHYGQEHSAVGQGHQGNYHRHAPSHHQYKDSVGTEYSHQATTTPPPTSAPSSGSKLRFNENVTVSKFDAEATTMFEDDFAGRGSDVEQDLGGDPQQQQQGGWPSTHSTSPGPTAAAASSRASPAGTGASGPTSNNGSNKKILKTSSQPSYHHTQHSQQYHQQQQQHQKQYHQDNIRKSDSINIFAKKVDDPFEDDDFFSSQGAERDPFGGGSGGGAGSHEPSGAAPGKAQASSAGGVGAATGTGWDKNFANFDDNI
ncbi:protein disabled-like isoform X2 [Anopheles albimanus]|uniref:protein disabled-like isoform X2 n=1 Tax=Anopheles albimanus TaxID=7167 RepID=UPI001641DF79|nr:protein disabled-like isoform X2 [Anopheles albimanus]